MKANDTQVAGTHYSTPYQHWDLVADTGMGYFEGQVTKYVTRHRSKKGKEDLEKALHFLQKLTELAQTRHWHFSGQHPKHDDLLRYRDANKLTRAEIGIISRMLCWSLIGDLEGLTFMLTQLIEDCYPTPRPAPRLLDGDPDGPNYGKAG